MSDKSEVSHLTIIAAQKANKDLGDARGEDGKPLLGSDTGAKILNKYEESESNRDNSHKDPLTELLNRRGVKEESERVLGILKRENDYKGFTIVVADMIGLKKINQDLGELGADGVLIQSSQAIKSSATRATDLVSRWGGDEFVLILFNQDPETILNVCDRMLSTQPFVDFTNKKVQFNIGYMTFGPEITDVYSAVEYCVNQIDDVKASRPKDDTGRVAGDGIIVKLDG